METNTTLLLICLTIEKQSEVSKNTYVHEQITKDNSFCYKAWQCSNSLVDLERCETPDYACEGTKTVQKKRQGLSRDHTYASVFLALLDKETVHSFIIALISGIILIYVKRKKFVYIS